mgnify:FL=1
MAPFLPCNNVTEFHESSDGFFPGDTGKLSHSGLGRDEMQTNVADGSAATWGVLETQGDGLLNIAKCIVYSLALAVAPLQIHTFNPVAFSGLVGVDDDGE